MCCFQTDIAKLLFPSGVSLYINVFVLNVKECFGSVIFWSFLRVCSQLSTHAARHSVKFNITIYSPPHTHISVFRLQNKPILLEHIL